MSADVYERLLRDGGAALAARDPRLHDMLRRELDRQESCLSLVASSSIADPAVLAAAASTAVNVTAEGYPGRRYHAGCTVLDEIEALACERARRLFGASYVNVQPHSASTANYTVLAMLMRPGDTMLGMALDQGGHLTHGSPKAMAGQYFQSIGYGLTGDGAIDYTQVRRLAREHRPRLIVCGATAYPRSIDFPLFRSIADEVGAYLVADISHTAGLVATGLHPSPIQHAHVTTTCTHKQLYGPRGGIIMSGADASGPAPRGRGTLADFLQRAVFPFSQGAPAMNAIAAKAHALQLAMSPAFTARMRAVVSLAADLADALSHFGYRIVTGGTDNHIVLVDFGDSGPTGLAAERALELCGIIVNKNHVPGDTRPSLVTSGMRLGTNTIAARGMGAAQVRSCAELVHRVIAQVSRTPGFPFTGPGGERFRDDVRREVRELCERFPLPGYPAAARASVSTAGHDAA
jgi:glycine hydroxymethyltransferase